MGPNRRTLAIPLLLALWSFPAAAAEVRDDAKMFDPAAVEKARETLSKAESQTKIPVVIETVDSLGGEKIDDVALRLARRSGIRGVFVLISKAEHKLEVRDYKSFLGLDGRRRVRDAFLGPFKSGDFDTGLIRGADAISDVLATATPPSEVPARRGVAGAVPRPVPQQRGSGLPGWLVIGLILVAVFIGIRLLRGLFGGGGGYARPVAGPGMGGYGGGYGGGGGGGGGFMSSLFGGIGGAMAGNWLYDQMGGRHRGEGSYGSTPADPGAAPDAGATGGDWGGGGESADWGGGGGDAGGGGGGDWGGGGGGDWGGGGGGDGGGGGGGGGDW